MNMQLDLARTGNCLVGQSREAAWELISVLYIIESSP